MANDLISSANTPDFLKSAVTTFEGVQQLARVMADCGTLPDHLKDKPSDCFRVVVQAAKWGMDPFAVAECTSVVKGRLCYEGKLVHAVLSAMGAIRGTLDFRYDGPAGKDSRRVTVIGTTAAGERKEIIGTVADWKTIGNNSPWKPGAYDKMLAYRGTREWARMWAPAALLGVYTPDEFDEPAPRDVTGDAYVRPADPEPAAVDTAVDTAVDEKDEEPEKADESKKGSEFLHSARALYRELEGIEDGLGSAVIARFSRLHGADTPPNVSSDKHQAAIRDIQALSGHGSRTAVLAALCEIEDLQAQADREAQG